MSGCQECIVADIFTFPEKKQFDTITFLENNLGLGGSIEKTQLLLKKLASLLKDDGQILAVARNLRDKKYFAIELCPVWKDKIGPKFGWIHCSIKFLSDLCEEAGLHLTVLQGNQHSCLVRIVKGYGLKKQ